MAAKKLALGSALGFIEKIVTTIMEAIRKHGEESIFSLSDDKIRELTKQFVNSLVQASKPTLPIFKTITLGNTLAGYLDALKKQGFRVSDWASQILNKVSVANKQEAIDLVVLSVAELGFVNGTTLQEIYTKAKELGLELCPAEVGPALRLAYLDQPYGEWLVIAMEPVSDSDSGLRVFGVRRDGRDLWLDGRCGDADGFWIGSYHFVFVCPRK